jgi:hypothetical protein
MGQLSKQPCDLLAHIHSRVKRMRPALESTSLCLLCHPLGGFNPSAAHLRFSLLGRWFPPGHFLSFHCFTGRLGLELLRQSTDLGSNAGIRLFDLGLNCLIEESGDLLKRFILHCLFSIRAFYRQAMDFGGKCFQLSLCHNFPR